MYKMNAMGRNARNNNVNSLSGWIQQLLLMAIFCLLSLEPIVCSSQQVSDETAIKITDQKAAISRIDDQTSSDSVRTASKVTIGLSLEKAIQIAIENNLNTLLARERRHEARGVKRESRAPLLPNLFAGVFQSNSTLNLFAEGLVFPIVPPFVGPFKTFDARINLSQTIFNLSAIRTFQSSQVGEGIAGLQENLAREQVATAATLGYVEVLRSEEALQAAQANLRLAQDLLQLAQDQHQAGIATGVDVARAKTSVSQNTLSLVQAQTSSEQAGLRLQRITGLPLGSKLVLTDSMRFAVRSAPTAEIAVTDAKQTRYELQIAAQILKQRKLERQAAVAEQYPSLGIAGNYGSSGVTPWVDNFPTRSVILQLNVPIFNGGLTRGRIDVAKSQEYQAELQLRDTEAQVEEDVRLALVTLASTIEQVRAAEATLNLAEIELRMARDRFAAGVTDNIEVIQAQTSLENGRNGRVTALAAYHVARVNLAAALGRAQSFRL
jgi:outer membrane protein